MSEKVFITDALRTPFGSFGGSLKDVEVEDLAALVIKAVVSRSKIRPEEVDAVHLGCANTAESKDVIAPVIARQALLKAGLASSKILGDFDEAKIQKIREKLNVNGGAIAIGHPLGATGARLVMTLAYELRRMGGGFGIAAICGGLAQGDAVAIRV